MGVGEALCLARYLYLTLPHPLTPFRRPWAKTCHPSPQLLTIGVVFSALSKYSPVRKSTKSETHFESNQGSGAFRSTSIGIASKNEYDRGKFQSI